MGFTRKQKHTIKDPGPEQCHPSVGYKKPPIGCFPREVLEKVANKLNLKPVSGSMLRKQIENAIHFEKGGEGSFLEALPFTQTEKDNLKDKYLRPSQPKKWLKDPDTWLDSLNIAAVLDQYEVSRPDFEFMGPFPIDFGAPNPYKTGPTNTDTCLMNEVCTLSVENSIKNGTNYIGIVYNLDPHYKSGSHWVANFINLKNKTCIYFDSYGFEPPEQIKKFMRWLTTHDSKFVLNYSSRRLQYKNTECGMYCLYFIIRMLYGDDFKEFSRSKPSDTDMLRLRSWVFST